MGKTKTFHLVTYTAMHFLVDLSCIFYLTAMVRVRLPEFGQWLLAVVLYNLFAFALPMFLGFMADLLQRDTWVSLAGCLLILLNYWLVPSPFASVALIGIGNGLFHIGGGRQVLLDSRKESGISYTPSGIFIASGALGVYLGRKMAGDFHQICYVLMWVLLLLCVLLLGYCALRSLQAPHIEKGFPQFTANAGNKKKIYAVSAVLLIFLVVVIRSYYGFAAVYSWNSTFWMGLLFTLCIVAGKFLGGILADAISVERTCILSLGGAGVLALFAANSPVCGCLSILLFNMTMPITLTILADIWKMHPGFAFGTLMMALFLGTLPSQLWNIRWLGTPLGLFALCLISLGLLLFATWLKKKCFL